MALFGGDRSVAVRLSLDIKGYAANAAVAAKKTQDIGKAAVEAAGKHKRAFDDVGSTFLKTGAAIGAVATTAVVAFAKFDQAMSRAAAGTNAAGGELQALRKAALDAGAATQYSATEAADAITALGKAGVDTADILGGGLDASLSLAAAGQLEVAQAAEIAATAMTQFGLKGRENIGKVADLLAAGAGKAQGDVTDLANALKFVGPVAASMRVSIEETTGVLAEFASQGIIGEQAGTSLRGVLGSLTSPSKAAADEIGALGIQLYDANGQFLGLQNVAGQLQKALGGMSDAQRDAALGVIFGNDQITAAKVLYAGGAAAVQEWTDKVNDSGFAAKQAALLMNNLGGDVEQLKGSLETAFIQSGSGANSGLRALTQTATDAVNLFGALPTSVQKNTVVIAGLTAGTLLLAGGMLKAAVAIKTAKTNMAELGISAQKTSRVMAGIGKAGAAATVLSFLPDATAALDKQFGVIGKSTSEMSRELALFANGADLAGESAKVFGAKLSGGLDVGIFRSSQSLKSIVNDLSGVNGFFNKDLPGLPSVEAEQIKNYSQALAQLAQTDAPTAAKAFDRLTKAGGLNADETNRLLDLMPEYKDYLSQVATQQAAQGKTAAEGATATGVLKEQMAGASYSAEQLAKDIDDANAATKNYNDAALESRSASRDFQAALDDARESLKQNGRTLDDTTPKGRANAEALDAIAAAAQRQADAVLASGGTQDDYTKSLQTSRAELVKVATKFYGNKTAAEKYADAVLGIPKTAKTTVSITGIGSAINDMDNLITRIAIANGKRVRIQVSATAGNVREGRTAQADGSVLRFYGNGGMEQHVAQIAPAGAVRVWAEPETGGEAYIPLAPAKRARSKAILAQTAKMFGMVAYADGGFGSSMPFGLGDVQQRYEDSRLKPISRSEYVAAVNAARNAAQAQRKAERDLAEIRRKSPKDTNAIRDAEDRLDRARRTAAAARAKEADAVARKNAPKGFSLAGYTKSLAGTVQQTEAYRGNLSRIAARGGDQLATLIEGMGADGVQLAAALAKASPKEFARIVALLKRLDPSAFAAAAGGPAGPTVRQFANGGIATGTGIRVWNEPETGGEAYIPLAASKAGRSRMIASDVVSRLGGTTTWSSARATSAAPSAVAAGGAAGAQFGSLLTAEKIELIGGTPQQVASEVMFRVRALG